MTNMIEVNNIGPITEFEYEFSGPGLHILRGKQGAGKTTVLRTAQLAVDGRTDVKPTKRDGSPRGEAVVCGKRLRIAKQVREEGEINVDGLGDLNIADLHAPKYQDPSTRDKHRIKTLVRLCGVQADASLFHDLLADQQTFDGIVPADSLSTDDLVEMAARVKRAIEKEALRVEAQENTERANARAQAQLAEGVDIEVDTDEALLQQALERAVELFADRKRQRANACEAQLRAALARSKLDELPTQAKSSAQLTQEHSAACERTRTATTEVARLLAELRAAEAEQSAAKSAEVSAYDLMVSSQRNDELTAGWRNDIAAGEAIVGPTDEQLTRDAAAVEAAKAALAQGAAARRAIVAREESSKYLELAEKLGRRAGRLRDAAHDTARVLTEAIASIPACQLRVRFSDAGDPRLVLATDRSEHEPFDDLSDGERWPVILQIAAAHNRLIVLPQAAYGELSPATRAHVDALAKTHGCYVLTAQADDGELRGEAFGGEVAAE
jgi:hypothetical protein